MIGKHVARFLGRFLPAEAQRQGARVIALGMVNDHVHVLLEVPSRWDIPRVVQGFKGASSHAVNADATISTTGLRWAAGYDARTVGPGQVARVSDYVRNQPAHHPDRAIV